jgi:cytochrome c oxidase subunit 1
VSLLGWAAGTMPAFIDGTIQVNYVMHNTMWVPGHFHTYLLLGMITMVFGFMYYLTRAGQASADNTLDRLAAAVFVIATVGFALSFLYSGKASVARRYAAHLPEWVPYDRVAVVFAALVVAAVAVFVVRFLARLPVATRDLMRPSLPRGVQA